MIKCIKVKVKICLSVYVEVCLVLFLVRVFFIFWMLPRISLRVLCSAKIIALTMFDTFMQTQDCSIISFSLCLFVQYILFCGEGPRFKRYCAEVCGLSLFSSMWNTSERVSVYFFLTTSVLVHSSKKCGVSSIPSWHNGHVGSTSWELNLARVLCSMYVPVIILAR